MIYSIHKKVELVPPSGVLTRRRGVELKNPIRTVILWIVEYLLRRDAGIAKEGSGLDFVHQAVQSFCYIVADRSMAEKQADSSGSL
jgi:hypothetical protein